MTRIQNKEKNPINLTQQHWDSFFPPLLPASAGLFRSFTEELCLLPLPCAGAGLESLIQGGKRDNISCPSDLPCERNEAYTVFGLSCSLSPDETHFQGSSSSRNQLCRAPCTRQLLGGIRVDSVFLALGTELVLEELGWKLINEGGWGI